MINNNTSTSLYIPLSGTMVENHPLEDYSIILEQYGASYHKAEYYWEVGASAKVQGWILHLSVVAIQLSDLLQKILPVLLAYNVPFKVAKDKATARNILDGNLGGLEQIGKVISIYPENDKEALDLAQQLIPLTTMYKGPVVATDVYLGGVVYTRYGGINPIIRPGAGHGMENFIYGSNGELVRDNYSVPFQLPSGIDWPFGVLALPIVPRSKKNLQDIYKPLSTIKPDVRGAVIKALYLKGFLRVGSCVIKQGKKNMLTDDTGRDIRDRLLWQLDLHKKLGNIIPLPKIIGFFEENGDSYLAMEFIKGKTLHESLTELNSTHSTWLQMSQGNRLLIMGWLLKILSIIETMHENGFVHRDIAPGNFIIDRQGRIVLIDIELAYDLNSEIKAPPFELGTPGFMSPEQESVNMPATDQDIYSLGALMINIFTGLSALKFSRENSQSLFTNLFHFIGDKDVAKLISSCLNFDPSMRPGIKFIKTKLLQYRDELQSGKSELNKVSEIAEDTDMQMIILGAFNGLSKAPMPVSDGIWMSKTLVTNTDTITIRKDFSVYAGLHTGISGVLYLLARAHGAGFDVQANQDSYYKNWKYVANAYLDNLSSIGPSLFSGAAGIALALSEGLEAGLLDNTVNLRNHILSCLDLPVDTLNLAEGIAGQGISVLKCQSYLEVNKSRELADRCIASLKGSQLPNGSWMTIAKEHGKEAAISISLSYGMSGIICFLLEYINKYPNESIKASIYKGLNYILKQTNDLNELFNQNKFKKVIGNSTEFGDERTGVILCLIKAYELMSDIDLKKIAENALSQYPEFVISNNYSQDGGLAALGEVYLEAARVFKNAKWKRRADRIASTFIYTAYGDKSAGCYWMMDETNKPTVDLLTGNSGIIHFLLRCEAPDRIGHIVLT